MEMRSYGPIEGIHLSPSTILDQPQRPSQHLRERACRSTYRNWTTHSTNKFFNCSPNFKFRYLL